MVAEVVLVDVGLARAEVDNRAVLVDLGESEAKDPREERVEDQAVPAISDVARNVILMEGIMGKRRSLAMWESYSAMLGMAPVVEWVRTDDVGIVFKSEMIKIHLISRSLGRLPHIVFTYRNF